VVARDIAAIGWIIGAWKRPTWNTVKQACAEHFTVSRRGKFCDKNIIACAGLINHRILGEANIQMTWIAISNKAREIVRVGRSRTVEVGVLQVE